MAQKWSAFATRLLADPAGVAAAMGGGTTSAEVSALAAVFNVLAVRNDLAQPPVQLANTVQVLPG